MYFRFSWFLFSLSLCPLGFICISLQAETLRVGGPDADFESLAAAVNAAQSGDIVLIGPGIFDVSDTIAIDDKSIRVIGSGIWKTVLRWSGPATDSIFCLMGAAANGCQFEDISFHDFLGHSFWIEETDCQIRRCWFVGGMFERDPDHYQGSLGGAIHCQDALVQIDQCLFLNCSTYHDSGGALNGQKTRLGTSIRGCYFLGNFASEAGGAIALEEGEFEMESCYFLDNWGKNTGGAVDLARSNGTIRDCHFAENNARFGGAIYLDWSSEKRIQISGTDFFENRSYKGGAVCGYGTHDSPPNQFVFEDNACENNVALFQGGALDLYGVPTIRNSTFDRNRVEDGWGGAIILGSPRSNPHDFLMTGCTFSSNEADYGGAIKMSHSGFHPSPSSTNQRFEDCLFLDNQAKLRGGAIYAESYAIAFLSNCQFDNNRADIRNLVYTHAPAHASFAGCAFGSHQPVDLGKDHFIGPANHFLNQPPVKIAWDLRRENPLARRFTSFWPINFSWNPMLTRWPLIDLPFDVDALAFLPDGDILFSVRGRTLIPGLSNGPDGEWVRGEDIIRFRPTRYGHEIPGKMEFYFDGSDVGLSTHYEDIDALTVDDSGKIYISTRSGGKLPTLGGFKCHSILRFSPTALGAATSGQWEILIDGNDIGLNSNSENIDALDLLPAEDGAALSLLISVSGEFDAPGFDGTYQEPELLQFNASFLGTGDFPTTGTWKIYEGDDTWSYPSSGSIHYAALID